MQKMSRGQIALPSIQREYVWTDLQVINFLDSIFKQRPLGNQFHLWIPNAEEYQKVSEHARSIHSVSSKGTRALDYLIIDGQQRLTSLHRIYSGESQFLFDPINKTFHTPNLDKLDKLYPKHSNGRYIDVKDLWLWPNTLEAFLDKATRKAFLSQKDNIEVLNNIQQLMDELQGLAFDCTILDGQTTSEIIDIFILLNSAGTKVNTKEAVIIPLLIQSIPNMRDMVTGFINDKIKSQYGNQFEKIIDVNFVCMTTIYQMFGYTNNIKSYKTKDEYLKTDAGQEELEKNFQIVTQGILKTLKLLSEKLGINTSSMVETYFSIQVLSLAFGNRKKSDNDKHILSGVEENAALLYFLVANSRSRYSGSKGMELRKNDIELARKGENSFVHLGKAMLMYRNRKDQTWFNAKDLENVKYQTGRSPVINLLGIVLWQRDAIGFYNGFSKIDFNNSDRHHIFPVSQVKESKHKDNIGNITFIHNEINRNDFKDSLPHVYMKELGVLKGMNDKTRVFEELNKHLIDLERIDIYSSGKIPRKEEILKDYHSFIEIRRHEIANEFNKLLNKYT